MVIMVVKTVSVRALPLSGRAIGKGLTRAGPRNDVLTCPARRKDAGFAR